METEIVRPQSHQEWLELRENGIGSSEIGTIAGLNPYETPYQLWRRRVGIDAPRPETFAMRMGHILEPIVGSLWQDETACEIIPESKGEWFVRRADRPYLFASPDFTFRYPGGAGEIGILECKTTQRAVDPDDIPPAWFCQVQYQLGVAGYARGAIAWLSRGSEFGHVPIDFNPAFFEWLAALADTFYNVNIKGRVAPDMLTGRDAALRFPGHEPGAASPGAPRARRSTRRSPPPRTPSSSPSLAPRPSPTTAGGSPPGRPPGPSPASTRRPSRQTTPTSTLATPARAPPCAASSSRRATLKKP